MPRRGQRLRPVAGAPGDPRGMARAISEHLAWLRLHNYSPRTVRMRDFYLNAFAAWLEERGVTRPTDVTKPMLERYQRHLFHQR